ncbi:hypothetical protein AAFF_G00116390 [Aldrovandia affinis]|uniref:Uncharacterized protein n=1 Tax=Aldrovandia affinis TaxID=143900 RepID=A0AAD7T1J9_9TELE|nr:hypothetical protein AAFF_G00116390 [Aldrovandia affinis]
MTLIQLRDAILSNRSVQSPSSQCENESINHTGKTDDSSPQKKRRSTPLPWANHGVTAGALLGPRGVERQRISPLREDGRQGGGGASGLCGSQGRSLFQADLAVNRGKAHAVPTHLAP